MKNNQKNASLSIKKLSRASLVAALYVAFTFVSAMFGLSSGVIQFRLSEALCILPLFFPEAIYGLFVGCLLSNLLTACAVWDIIFGSIATLLGAIGAYLFRKLPERLKWLATLPTVISNSVIIPFILIYAYGSEGSFFFFMLTVFIGEAVCASLLGSILYYTMRKNKLLF